MLTRLRFAVVVAALALCCGWMSGCGLFGGSVNSPLPATPVRPPGGWLFTDVKAPLMTDMNNTTFGSKNGSASTMYLNIPLFGQWSFAWDDASIEKAAANGGLRTVKHADYQMMQLLGIFGRFTVTAYGD